jgi:hypothetical protein
LDQKVLLDMMMQLEEILEEKEVDQVESSFQLN